jgi:two-component system, NarL family, sensor histidine kinase UhpB
MPAVAVRSEAGELALTFNEMLDRLEAERHHATGRVLAGQEAERLRIAQELHDDIGQELTAVLLSLAGRDACVHRAEGRCDQRPGGGARQLGRRAAVAIELRPEALDDLGLESPPAVLCERFAERTGLRITEHVDPEMPPLSPEIELVVYRVAQEAVTNLARHSGALPADYMAGSGMRGMRERATLVGAHLTIGPQSAAGGCRVRLDLALEDRR